MAITETTVFDKVRVLCNCAAVRVYEVQPRNGNAKAVGAEGIQPTTTDTDKIAQLDIMRDAVIAGTASIEYQDGSRTIPYADLPFEHSLVHTLHSIHPEDGWKATGTLVRNADVTEDADTGRSDIITQFGLVPEKRRPDGDTYDYPLDRWNVRLVPGSQIAVDRNWSADDNVTAPNDHDDVRGMLAWLEEHRVTGSGTAFGDDITALSDLSGRTVRIDQGDTDLDVHITSIGSNHVDGVYSHVGFSFSRISTETDDVDIAAVRALFMAAVGSIDVASEDTPEEPPWGSTSVRGRVKDLEFPDGTLLELVNGRVMVRSPTLSREPIGSGRRTVRYAELAFQDVAETVRYMPSDGRKIVHFGHDATADGTVQFQDNISEHTTSEDLADVYEVLNISDSWDCRINAGSGGGILINLKPGQQVAIEIAEDNADGDEELIALDPPERRIQWTRGVALPTLAGQRLYTDGAHQFVTLPWPTSLSAGVSYIDTDGFSVGSASLPTDITVASVPPANWDIPGSVQIKRGGLVDIDVRYQLSLDADPPTDLAAVLAQGHGASLWFSEGGTAALDRILFLGLAEMSAIGDKALVSMLHLREHSANTRFVFMHRVPSSSTVGTDDDSHAYLGQIKMEALSSRINLKPVIRWTSA